MTLQEEEDALISRFSNLYTPAFAEIPRHLQTERLAKEWLTILSNLNFDAVISYWEQIPAELITDELREKAIGLDVRIIQHIDPSDTESYLDLFIRAFKTSWVVLPLLHPDFKTSSTIDLMLSSARQFEYGYQKNSWIADVMTPDQWEAASRISAKIMADLPVEKISPEALHTHLSIGYSGYGMLHKKGKLKLAADYLKQGHWPVVSEALRRDIERPGDIAQGLSLALEYDSGGEALYLAYLMTHPVEEVLSVMSTREHISYLLEMYTPEELRPFIRTHRHLKAALLEESLGL
jgi:hypothetical protein